MSNFVKKRLARESVDGSTSDAVLEIEVPEENTEGLLSEISSDTQDIELLDVDGSKLAEDTDLVEGQLDNVDAAISISEGVEPDEGSVITEVDSDMSDTTAENIEIAVESVRRRWGICTPSVTVEAYGSVNRRLATRESLWTTFKELVKRMIEWLKVQGHKVKDRWLKFTNVGKSMVKRANKYDALLKKCTTKDKDDISGAFIKQLSIGKSFEGNNKNAIESVIKSVEVKNTAQKNSLEKITKLSDEFNNLGGDGLSIEQAVAKKVLFGKEVNSIVDVKVGKEELLGGKVEEIKKEDDDYSFAIIDTDASIESDVPTPSTSQISTLIGTYKKLGTEVEKRAIAYRDVNAARDKFNKALDKFENTIDKFEGKLKDGNVASYSDLMKIFRTGLNNVRQITSHAESVNAHVIQSACAGLNGYIVASIAAYKKK